MNKDLSLWCWPLENKSRVHSKGKIITFLIFLSKKFKLLVILFIKKHFAQVNVFWHIEKYGKNIIRASKKSEDLINKHTKIQMDIDFIKTYKREDLIPTFATGNVAIKRGIKKLKVKVTHAVMETEMQNKHN